MTAATADIENHRTTILHLVTMLIAGAGACSRSTSRAVADDPGIGPVLLAAN